MQAQTLVLDIGGEQAIRVAPWKKVMTMLLERAAEVVEHYPDKYIRTPRPLHFSLRCLACENDSRKKRQCWPCAGAGFIGETSHRFPTCTQSSEERWQVNAPAVVRLLVPIPFKPTRSMKPSRLNIYARDKWRCQYCGRKRSALVPVNLDHVVPRAQGGKTSWTNVVCCCVDCNQKKGNRTPEQAGMRLLAKPVRPTSLPQKRSHIEYQPGMPKEWIPYLRDAAYWNAPLDSDE